MKKLTLAILAIIFVSFTLSAEVFYVSKKGTAWRPTGSSFTSTVPNNASGATTSTIVISGYEKSYKPIVKIVKTDEGTLAKTVERYIAVLVDKEVVVIKLDWSKLTDCNYEFARPGYGGGFHTSPKFEGWEIDSSTGTKYDVPEGKTAKQIAEWALLMKGASPRSAGLAAKNVK